MRGRLGAVLGSVVVTLVVAGLVLATPGESSAATRRRLVPALKSAAPTVLPPGVGFNEGWGGLATFDTMLTPADLSALKAMGTTMMRFGVACNVVSACRYVDRYNDSTDFRKVTTWYWGNLDTAVSELLAAGITPVIAPSPGDRMFRPGYIVDDGMYASTTAFVDQVVTHLSQKFGPLPYSFFETEQTTGLIQGADGVQRYRYLTAAGFPASFAAGLRTLYGNDVGRLNQAYGTSYAAFADVPVPDLGSSAGVPTGVYDSPATTDVRRIIGTLSASRYSAIGQLIHQRSPGSEFWGPTVQLQSFDDRRQSHTPTALTTVGPTLSDLAAQPGIDVLSVDGYRNNDPATAAAEWRIAAKMAARAGKQVAITEIGAENLPELQRAMDSVRTGASNLRAVLIWEAKDHANASERFGTMTASGDVKPGYASAVGQFFTDVRSPGRAIYIPGREAVFYPEWGMQVVQNGKLTTTKTLALMADLMAAGYTVEPINDDDVAGASWIRLSVYSLYMNRPAVQALVTDARPVIGYQFAAHRGGFSAGRAVDTTLWPSRAGIAVSPAEAASRVAETVTLLGGSYLVTADYRLAGSPFVHLTSAGTTQVIGVHGIPAGAPMAVRTANGSVWSDQYIGSASLPVLYGTPH